MVSPGDMHRGGRTLAAGEVLVGKYRIERVLGRGGMGVVYAAHHILLDRPVALKLLASNAAMQPDALARFLNEARNAARVDNEYVCRVMDLGVSTVGQPYIAMELLEGTDLGRVLAARGPLPVVEAVGYVLQALSGIGTAHLLGIVHRDLKPSNLFIAQKPGGGAVVKVLDFGISKATGSARGANLTALNTTIGSPAYMSPEQVSLAPTIDARADLWAVGVILYELLTGRLPFAAHDVAAALAFILERDPAPVSSLRPDVPRGLEAVIARCLAKDPAQRFASAAELAASLAPFGPWAASSSGIAPERASLPDANLVTTPGVWTHKGGPEARVGRTSLLRMVGIGAGIGVAMLAILVAVSWRESPRAPAAAVSAPAPATPTTAVTASAATAAPPAASSAPPPDEHATPQGSATEASAEPSTTASASASAPHSPGRVHRPMLSRQRR